MDTLDLVFPPRPHAPERLRVICGSRPGWPCSSVKTDGNGADEIQLEDFILEVEIPVTISYDDKNGNQFKIRYLLHYDTYMEKGEMVRLGGIEKVALIANQERQQRMDDLLKAPIHKLIDTVGAAVSKNPSKDQRSDPRSVRIFLSYARPDRTHVSELFDRLASDGFSPWMDFKSILPGENWRSAIYHAIDSADFFILCLSRHSVNRRGFLQREIRTALDKLTELLDEDIYLIPVRLEPCPLPSKVGDEQAVDLFEADGYERLLRGLRVGTARRQENAGDRVE